VATTARDEVRQPLRPGHLPSTSPVPSPTHKRACTAKTHCLAPLFPAWSLLAFNATLPLRIPDSKYFLLQEIKSVGEDVEKKEPSLQHWGECKLVQPLWKPIWRLLKKLKLELPYYPAFPLLDTDIDKKEMKSLS